MQTETRDALNSALDILHSLPVSALLTLQEAITRELRQKVETVTPPASATPLAAPNGTPAQTPPAYTSPFTPPQRRLNIPGTHQYTHEEIEESLAAIFTPEELAEINTSELGDIPTGGRTIMELLDEDREDRF